jgi:SAM-dependent methyltransferase
VCFEDTPHKKYLSLAAATIGLRGQSVLEVGGCSPPSLVQEHAPAKWTCVDMHPPSVAEFNEKVRDLSLPNYTALRQDVATFDANDVYDRIYSINSFEHISDLGKAFAGMYRALKPGGYLFTLFGPIWSSDVGHHLSIPTEKGPLSFHDGVLEPWEHLTSTPEALHAKLEKRHGDKIATRAVSFIYTYPDINRMFEHQYLAMLDASGFSRVMIVRNRQGHPPDVPGATNTREFVWVLKKGRAGLLEKAMSPARFGIAYLSSRIHWPEKYATARR